MTQSRTLASLSTAFLFTTAVLAQSGTLDPSFSGDGIQILQPGTVHDVGNEVLALGDTTLLVCGTTKVGAVNSAFVVHLLQDGSVDASWGTSSGYTFLTVGLEAYLYDMALGADGSIYLCGLTYITYAQSEVLLVKLLADGTPDPGFGTNGVIHTLIGSGDAQANGIAIDANDKIVLGGSAGPFGAYDALIMRCNADGTPDATFSGDGIQTATAITGEDLLLDVAILADGSIVGAGYADISFNMKAVLVRVDANGDLVNAFDGDGVMIPSYSVTLDRAFGILSEGQQFYVCGGLNASASNEDAYLAKHNDDGTLVSGFGTGGIATMDVNEEDVALDIARQTDGRLVISGTTGQFGFFVPRDFLVARLTDAGAPDVTFDTDGVVTTSIQPDFDDANGVAIQPDGKIVVAGFTAGLDNDLVIARYLVDAGTSGIADPAQGSADLLLFPNPATDRLFLSGPMDRASRCLIIDAMGRVVMDGLAPTRPIDVSPLASGPYQLLLVNGATIQRAGFVKQ